jgi:hypothetical protein
MRATWHPPPRPPLLPAVLSALPTPLHRQLVTDGDGPQATAIIATRSHTCASAIPSLLTPHRPPSRHHLCPGVPVPAFTAASINATSFLLLPRSVAPILRSQRRLDLPLPRVPTEGGGRLMGTGAGSVRAMAAALAVLLLACSGAVAVARAQDTERIEGTPPGPRSLSFPFPLACATLRLRIASLPLLPLHATRPGGW